MGDTYYYVRKEKILIGNSNADICIPDMEKEYLLTEKEISFTARTTFDLVIPSFLRLFANDICDKSL